MKVVAQYCRTIAVAAAALVAMPLSAEEAAGYECAVSKAPADMPALMVDAYLSDDRDSRPEFLAARKKFKALVTECEAELSIGEEHHKSFLDYTLFRLMKPEIAERLREAGIEPRNIDRDFELDYSDNWEFGESPEFDRRFMDALRPLEGNSARQKVVSELLSLYIVGRVKGREALKGLQ